MARARRQRHRADPARPHACRDCGRALHALPHWPSTSAYTRASGPCVHVRRAPQKSALTKHSRTHTGERPTSSECDALGRRTAAAARRRHAARSRRMRAAASRRSSTTHSICALHGGSRTRVRTRTRFGGSHAWRATHDDTGGRTPAHARGRPSSARPSTGACTWREAAPRPWCVRPQLRPPLPTWRSMRTHTGGVLSLLRVRPALPPARTSSAIARAYAAPVSISAGCGRTSATSWSHCHRAAQIVSS